MTNTPMTPQHDIEELRKKYDAWLAKYNTPDRTTKDVTLDFITAYCQKREAILLDEIEQKIDLHWKSNTIGDGVRIFIENKRAELFNQQPSIETKEG